MDKVTANPLFVGLLCLARCMVPVIFMLGVTYLLKRFGIFAEPTPPPNNYEENNNNPGEGGLAHDGA